MLNAQWAHTTQWAPAPPHRVVQAPIDCHNSFAAPPIGRCSKRVVAVTRPAPKEIYGPNCTGLVHISLDKPGVWGEGGNFVSGAVILGFLS